MDLAEKHSSRRNCQAGFQTVALTIWLPVFLNLMIVVVVIANVVLVRAKTNTLCFKSSLSLQNQLRQELVQLMKLNPKAKKARAFRKISEANLKAALASKLPAWIIEAQAQRALAIAQQMQIRQQQQQLLQKARRFRIEFTQKIKLQMRALDARARTQSETQNLAVIPVPPTDLSPDYLPSLAFEKTQAQTTTYKFSIFQGAPQWISKNFSYLPQQAHQCSASLKGFGLFWSPTMTKGSPSLSW